MSAKTLELTREMVKTLANQSCGTMVVSTYKYEILVLRDQHSDFRRRTGRVFDMILVYLQTRATDRKPERCQGR